MVVGVVISVMRLRPDDSLEGGRLGRIPISPEKDQVRSSIVPCGHADIGLIGVQFAGIRA